MSLEEPGVVDVGEVVVVEELEMEVSFLQKARHKKLVIIFICHEFGLNCML